MAGGRQAPHTQQEGSILARLCPPPCGPPSALFPSTYQAMCRGTHSRCLDAKGCLRAVLAEQVRCCLGQAEGGLCFLGFLEVASGMLRWMFHSSWSYRSQQESGS